MVEIKGWLLRRPKDQLRLSFEPLRIYEIKDEAMRARWEANFGCPPGEFYTVVPVTVVVGDERKKED